ncbi:ATP synthase F1 subunit epsilon [Candidatus Roizmanbacteria bacterium CG_4_8_14_3_um_filter_34_9]|uniref:ATP synthase epsilon chain n=3 Tax=Candidatus Roizmaniibacteriota TaxID=1752723 RepID=A0A2M7ATU1_9BACT|nr:MAG: ATP synthase F1 subunit epsilon [Candidatus Roizmanbacteria bacterium CG07_land_8_20_14_0_80_34_15]PIU74049.1 MAG: ATP synthase F1 subunit epsilon [Candidatus Roizmanbacteria bacterium CG06_land_8_20_14_3_00_34_14]PIW73535.1 MAG: ATP synthase F1 subunit epsilon [Candidatus Roizmanbacteria bacterium CG_4_8_14_3_um_filter_34_9]
MNSIHLKVITPRKIVIDKQVNSVTVPTADGEISIRPHHAHLFSLLVEGIVKIKTENNEDDLAIGGGYLETNGETLTVLVSRAYGQGEIDKDLTNKAIEEAKLILSKSTDERERAEAMTIIRRSVIDSKLMKRRKTRSV